MSQNNTKHPTRLTAQMIITSSGAYPDRAKSPELTPAVLNNIQRLVQAVNALLDHIQWQSPITVSSGFRTAQSNAQTTSAARRSLHMLGLAVDIMQPKNNNALAHTIRQAQAKDQILTKLGLWMENPQFTVGENTSWVHLDLGQRADRPSREFNP